VHHILAGWLPKMPANGRGFDWEISMGGYAVREQSNTAPANWASIGCRASSAISFQMHYTPIGKAFTDTSRDRVLLPGRSPGDDEAPGGHR